MTVYQPDSLKFDSSYKDGEYIIFEETTKHIVARANSGNDALQLVDHYNKPSVKATMAVKFNDQLMSRSNLPCQ